MNGDTTIERDVFVVNLDTGEIHHENFKTTNCQLEEIKRLKLADSLADARRGYETDNGAGDLCAWCFRSKQ